MREKLKAEQDRMRKEFASLKREKAELEKALDHKEHLLNTLPVGFVVIRREKIIAANDVILHQLGYKAEEMLESDFKDFVAAPLKIVVDEIYGKRRLRKPYPDFFEVELICKNKTTLDCDAKPQKIRSNGRGDLLVTFTVNEERKRREKELVDSGKAEALLTMASGLRGALADPLRAIQDSASLAKQFAATPAHVEDFKGLEDAIGRVEDIVKAMECLTKVAPDPSRRVPFDLKKAVRDAIAKAADRVKEEAERRGTDIKIKTYLRPVSPVEGDPQEIQEMLHHVVMNAVDAMPKGGYIYLSTEESAGYAHVYIQDSGLGIPARIQDRILDPFFTTKGEERAGLGLSLVRAIVQRHNGQLEINSKKDEGTMVTARLPLAKLDVQSKRKPSTRKTIKNSRVLIIEEDLLIAELLSRTLESKGCRVTTTSSAAEGLTQWRRKGYDLVIVGSAVSDLNGAALAKRIKKSKSSSSVAFIADYDLRDEEKSVQGSPLDLVITKPIDINQAVERITEILKQRDVKQDALWRP
jgi:PAS domain S-box-containing protein